MLDLSFLENIDTSEWTKEEIIDFIKEMEREQEG